MRTFFCQPTHLFGIVRFCSMKILTDEHCAGYSHAGHPERPARIARTLEKLRSQNDLSITWAKPGSADEQAVLRAHSPEHVARLNHPEDFDGDTPFYPGIADYARASAGAALEALRCARAGETVFSLMRPPGHHAERHRAMGFCYLNNIAIAALEALATGTKRVGVYDFDVHHGNGTENILMNREGAAFFSIHQHPCYPGTGMTCVGNNCFNYPVLPLTPREEYRKTLAGALDGLRDFKPELVAVSAGFDAYARDPLAQETLEAEDFYWLGRSFHQLGVPVLSVLEGGYSKDLPELILAYLKGLDGK
jgi:acetoin utilization deacetylase AcuC-like enzyme